jgi:hypothetical protein
VWKEAGSASRFDASIRTRSGLRQSTRDAEHRAGRHRGRVAHQRCRRGIGHPVGILEQRVGERRAPPSRAHAIVRQVVAEGVHEAVVAQAGGAGAPCGRRVSGRFSPEPARGSGGSAARRGGGSGSGRWRRDRGSWGADYGRGWM